MTRLLSRALCALLALAAPPVLAGPVTFVERAPADPQAVGVAIDEPELRGTLPEPDLTDLIEAGRRLFDTRFTSSDGAGRPMATQAVIPTRQRHTREKIFQRASGPDANSCTSCHHDPIDGGAGDFTTNVFTSQGTESANFDTVDPQFSNERGTTHLFGAGLLELLAREMTADIKALRADAVAEARSTGKAVEVALVTKGVDFGTLAVSSHGEVDMSGVEGVDDDLTIRPFSQKGVTVSMRMFTLNALNSHHGIQGDERFGAAMTGLADFDGDGHAGEFGPGLVSAMVAYQASLEPPHTQTFDNPDWQAAAERGATHFDDIGCTACHKTSLPLESLRFTDPGPYDTAGTLSSGDVSDPAVYDLALLDWAETLERDARGNVLVPLFGDLKRHVIADDERPHFANELLSQSFVARDTFMTAELWGIADTAPYGHRADLSTLDAAIRAHGGEGASAGAAYEALPEKARNDLVTYLMTLRTPQ